MAQRILRRVPWATVAFAGLFVTGATLGATMSSWFLLVAGVGAFLPDLLRMSGILRDQDEFQAQARATASRLAVVVTGFYLCVAVVTADIGRLDAGTTRDVLLLAFVIMVGTRFVASLIGYWNPAKSAPYIFAAFGSLWAIFVVLSEWGNWVGLAIEAAAVAIPFAACAVLARRFPRFVGALAILIAIAAFVFFNLHRLFVGDLGSLLVFLLIPAPLVVSGVGLIGHKEVCDDA